MSFLFSRRVLLIVGVAVMPMSSCGDDAQPDFATRRKQMVETQLRQRGIKDQRVLQAMLDVERHLFVPETQRGAAYADRPLPLEKGQTISQPYIVAFMTEALKPQPDEKVLEIGTGSGYQAAVLAKLVKQVYTIEIIPSLAASAKKRLAELGYANVSVKQGDGYQGWAEHAPFDAILVTCAPEQVPQPLVDQLREGGRLVIPVGDNWSQQLVLLEKKAGKVVRTGLLPVVFVPMTGEAQKH